ncbi:hypothetical protein AB0M28_33550 [Streptomyces sp. NPDC051940]|uniref:hypothetical protein n=1 Tax=Streptomyces sp. NPDC051940 TaxID=3155675 RepID=UPI00341FDE1C
MTILGIHLGPGHGRIGWRGPDGGPVTAGPADLAATDAESIARLLALVPRPGQPADRPGAALALPPSGAGEMALRRAAETAGVTVVHAVPAPVAAALHYRAIADGAECTAVVCDVAESGADLTVLVITGDRTVRVTATEWHTRADFPGALDALLAAARSPEEAPATILLTGEVPDGLPESLERGTGRYVRCADPEEAVVRGLLLLPDFGALRVLTGRQAQLRPPRPTAGWSTPGPRRDPEPPAARDRETVGLREAVRDPEPRGVPEPGAAAARDPEPGGVREDAAARRDGAGPLADGGTGTPTDDRPETATGDRSEPQWEGRRGGPRIPAQTVPDTAAESTDAWRAEQQTQTAVGAAGRIGPESQGRTAPESAGRPDPESTGHPGQEGTTEPSPSEGTTPVPVEQLQAMRRDDHLLVLWAWPDGSLTARVRWRVEGDTPGRPRDRGDLTCPRRVYEHDGGLDLVVGRGAVTLTVEALVPGERPSGAASLRVPAEEPVIRYNPSVRRRLAGRVATVTFESDSDCELPAQRVVHAAGRYRPMSVNDGTVVHEVPATRLRAGVPATVEFPLPATRGPSWLVCFPAHPDEGPDVRPEALHRLKVT